MTQITLASVPGPSLPRLDDEGRAILFTSARTANTFSDRPVSQEQLMKWGPTWAFHHHIPRREAALT
jgi:hypothetical protein